MQEIYCVKCKAKRAANNQQNVVTKNGRAAVQGTCAVCGTKVYKFIKNS